MVQILLLQILIIKKNNNASTGKLLKTISNFIQKIQRNMYKRGDIKRMHNCSASKLLMLL